MVYVAVISYGKQSTQNILRLLDSLGVKSDVLKYDEAPRKSYSHAILSGGPDHVYDPDSPGLPEWLIEAAVPTLGICYGMQLVVRHYGGTVAPMEHPRIGPVLIYYFDHLGMVRIKSRWIYHLDAVTLPMFIQPLERTVSGLPAAIRIDNWMCVQYHPESPHYPDVELFRLFLQQIYFDVVTGAIVMSDNQSRQ
jgi:GMP synthase (glutamine-hydrolysing)